MGNRARRAVRQLKMDIHRVDETISLRNISDEIIAGLGRKRFAECKSCIVGVPVAGDLPTPDDINHPMRQTSTTTPRTHTDTGLSTPQPPPRNPPSPTSSTPPPPPNQPIKASPRKSPALAAGGTRAATRASCCPTPRARTARCRATCSGIASGATRPSSASASCWARVSGC